MIEHETRSLRELFSELARETKTLVQQEVRLAKTEMTHKAREVGVDVSLLAAGGAVAYAGFLVVLAGVVLVLALAMPLWLSALIVGVAVLAAGLVLAWRGMARLKHVDPAPHQTITSLEEDRRWLRGQMR